MPNHMTGRKQFNADGRKRGVRAMGDLLPGIGSAAFRRFGFIQNAVVARWPEIVGPRYAQFSMPESLGFPTGQRRGGTLRLLVEGAHALTIQHVAPQIIERVNRFFGYAAVERIAIKQGSLPKSHQRARPAASVSQTPPILSADVSGTLRSVSDPGLRNALEALAARVAESAGPPVFD